MAFPTGWSSKETITIDAEKVSDADAADLTNFPVLLTGANIPIGVFSNALGPVEIDGSWADESSVKAYYKFTSGALTTDTSGNTHTLTLVSNPSETTGMFDGGVELDSSDAYTAVDHADFKPEDAFTVMAWVKTAASGEGGIVQSFAFAGSQYAGWRFKRSGSVLSFDIGKNTGGVSGTDYLTLNGSSAINDDAWHHCAVVYDGTRMYVYVDGNLEARKAWSSNPAYQGTNYVRVGCLNNTGANLSFIDGDLDDVCLLHSALKAQQIRAIAQGGHDIRFSSDVSGAAEIAHEMVSWDATAETAEIWVKVPTVDYNDNTKFYMWYDNSSAYPLGKGISTIGSLKSDANLQAHWMLESDGTDETANNYDLSSGTAPSHATALFGDGADFEAGSSQYYTGSTAGLKIAGSQTWTFWIKPEDSIGNNGLMGFNDSDATEKVRFTWGSTGVCYWQLEGLAVDTVVSDLDTIIPDEWHHICGVFDTSADTMSLFVNGVKTTVTGCTGAITFPTSNNWAIGRAGDRAINYVDGIIDDCAIFDRALTDQEVMEIYGNGAGVYTDDYKAVYHAEKYYYDSTAYGNIMAHPDAPPEMATGQIGTCWDFETSSSEYVGRNDTVSLSITGDISIDLWFKPETLGIDHNLISKWDSAATKRSYIFKIGSADDLRFIYSDDGDSIDITTLTLASGSVGLSIGTWTHLVVVTDVSNKSCTFYVDGTDYAGTLSSGTHTSIHDNTSKFGVGCYFSSGAATSFMDGMVDEVCVYSGLMTEGWAKTMYANQDDPGTFIKADDFIPQVIIT